MLKIEEFKFSFSWLSNFWFCDVMFEGVKYPTVEHAYQAAKFSDTSAKELIRRAETAGKAKKLGGVNGLPNSFREDWEQVKVSIMKDLLREKFKNPHMRDKLIATKDSILEEGNHWHDRFWGICPPGSNQGQNILGKLLMEVREEIKEEE